MMVNGPLSGLFGLFAFFPCCFPCCGVIFGIAAFAIWIWALIEVLTKEPSEGNDKVVWLLVVLFTHFIGALIYLLIRRPERKKKYGQ